MNTTNREESGPGADLHVYVILSYGNDVSMSIIIYRLR